MDLACSLRLLRHWTFQHRPLSPWSFGSAFCCSRHLHTKNVRKLRCCRKIRSQKCVIARFSSTTSTSAHASCGAFGQGHYVDFSYILYMLYKLNAFMMSFGFKGDETPVFSIQCCQAVWMLMYAFHSYFDCRFARIVWVSALNDATPFTWRQGSQCMLFHLVWPPHLERERCYSYHWTAQRSLPRVSSLLNMQHAASIRNPTVLRRNSCGRLQQGGRHPKRSQHSWPPLAFRCARLLWILLAARSKRCGKLSWFVHPECIDVIMEHGPPIIDRMRIKCVVVWMVSSFEA